MFEELKNNVEQEFLKIADCIENYESKENILKANTSDVKNVKNGLGAAISFVPAMCAGISIIAPISAGLALPMTSAMAIAFAMSVAVGYAGQEIITAKAKKQMKKITASKTNAEIIEEMMSCGIEREKLEGRQEILRKIYRAIETKEQILSESSIGVYQEDKYEKLSLDELKTKQEKITTSYNEKMHYLDVVISQNYLNDQSKSFRKKGIRIENIVLGSIGVGLFISFFLGIPLALELNTTMLQSFSDFIKLFAIVFSPTLLVAPLTIPYFYKRNKDKMKAFNNLNQTLGENALSENVDIDYYGLNDSISRRIDEIVVLGMELKEIGYAIEKRSSETIIDNKENEKSKSKSWNDVMYTEEKIRHYTSESPAPFNPETIFNTEANSEDQTNGIQQEQSGPRLVKKRILPQNRGNK